MLILLSGAFEQVESFELMKPNGEVIKVRHGSDDIFRVAGVGLGALGILLNITLKCEPAFTLETRQFPLPLFEVGSCKSLVISPY